MDAVIQQLQPAEGQSPAIPNPDAPPQEQPQFIPEHPVEQQIPQQPQPQPQPVPVEPAQPVDPDAGEKLLAEIDALLNEIDEKPKVEPAKPEAKVELVSPKALENLDNEKLSIDEKQEIINYVTELETQVAENDFNFKTVKIERDQLEHMLEKERAKNNEVFDKFKELERENKKVKA